MNNMSFKKLVAAVALMGLTAFSHAAPSEAELIKEYLKYKVDGVRKLPVSGLSMIEAGGKMFIVSDNGRIVITGKIYDMWNGVEMKGIEDADRYSSKIDLKKLGLNIEELNPFSIGSGKSEVIIFIDPNCTDCYKLLQSAFKLPNHTFKVILLPILNVNSVEKAKRAICHTDKAMVTKAIFDNEWDKIPAAAKDCSTLAINKAIVIAKIFGMTGIPFLIGPGGATSNTAPKDLAAWITEMETDAKNNPVASAPMKIKPTSKADNPKQVPK